MGCADYFRERTFSPLFIGEGSSTRSPLDWLSASRSFSPLFIGEGSSTNGALVPVPVSSFFQSPLHRGRLFNRKTRQGYIAECVLSVPSSSGKALQPALRSIAAPRCPVLSVPSSSGKALQLETTGTIRTARFSFSPLFIGEGSSTACDCSPARVRQAPFSPLFIGEGSSTKK